MKIFKLKYVALALTLATLGSCASDDSLKEGEKTTADENTFVFEDGINNYVINGQLTFDHKVIGNAAKDAWNIHYDYPHNKVVISTTSGEFEKYKSSDTEFKSRFESPNLTPAVENNGTNSSKAAVTYNQYDAINYTNHLVFYWHDASGQQYTIFPVVRNNDVNIGFNAHYIRNNATTYVGTFNIAGSRAFNTGAHDVNDDTYLRNTATTSKTITFFSGTNNTGTTTSITLGAAAKTRIINRSGAASYR